MKKLIIFIFLFLYYNFAIDFWRPNVVVQLLSSVLLFATPAWRSQHASLPKLMSVELVMPSNHLVVYHPLLLPLVFPSIRVFSNESALRIRWPKYWSFSISPSNNYLGLISSGLTGLISLQSKGLPRVFNTIVQKHQFFSAQLSLWSSSHIHTWLLEKP